MPPPERRILLDLNNPIFLDAFLALERSELAQVVLVLKRIRAMEWATFLRHRGTRWEEIAHLQAPNGHVAQSFRRSEKYRALA